MNQTKNILKYGASIILLLLMIFSLNAFSQVYSNMEVGAKNEKFIDSLKSSEYPYVLPIWGKKATKAGFNLPYSAGINVNYLWQESELTIENLQVGFNNGPLHDLDEIVRFDKAVSNASAYNFRPDIWLFPFLNVYGILAQSKPSTSVDYTIWVPDSSGNWKQVIALNSKAEFDATTFGFGLTPTIGIGGGWMALDMNFTWSDISALEKPAFAFIFAPRLGKTFKLKAKDRNFAIWVGGFRLKLNTGTSGSLPIGEVLSTEGLQTKVDNGIDKITDSQEQVDIWWSNLSSTEQRNPVNIAKYETANRALEKAGSFLNSMDESLSNIGSSTVQYSLDKRPKDKWNFVIGTQFQYNKHIMARFEYSFLGSRTQIIAGLQYRFGL